MNYTELCERDYPTLEESKMLYSKCLNGSEKDKWEFTLSQGRWVKKVIKRYFRDRESEELYGDGIIASFFYACQTHDKTMAFIVYKKYCILSIKRAIENGIRSRESQLKGDVNSVSIDAGWQVDVLDDDMVADNVENKDNTDFFIKIVGEMDILDKDAIGKCLVDRKKGLVKLQKMLKLKYPALKEIFNVRPR